MDLLIEGHQVDLKSLSEKEVYGCWWQWFNDKEVTLHMNKGSEQNTPEKQLEFFRKMQASDKDFILGIFDNISGKHIGTTGIHNIHLEGGKRVGSFGIIIGEKKFWGKGIGTESWMLMVRYAFEILGLQALETKIFADNTASLKIAQKTGFREVKISRGEFIKEGRKIDRVILRLEKENGK